MAVDAEGAVKDWINSLTEDLVGVGNPLQLGAHLEHLRSPAKGAYAYLLRVSGAETLTAERPADRALISASIYGPTRKAASFAANAYHQAIQTRLRGGATPMGSDVVCVAYDSLTGPIGLDPADTGEGEWRFLVDAGFHLYLASALV